MDADPTQYQYHPTCEFQHHSEVCGKPAVYIAKGCMDKQPVLLCDDCYVLGITRLVTYLQVWQRVHKRVMICGDCHRPVLNLDTHLDRKYIE